MPDETEKITDGVYYLGNYAPNDMEEFEIHILHDDETLREERLQEVVQQLASPAVILCLSRKPTPFKHDRLRVISLHDCLKATPEAISWQWPKGAFDFKHPDKQKAAQMRHAKDPKQRCKAALKERVGKHVNSYFRDLWNHEIRQKIEEEKADWLHYEDRNGARQKLSDQMVKDAIREVLDEKGLGHLVSGRGIKA